jgi:hypothetical protein
MGAECGGKMLTSGKLVGFVTTTDYDRARAFYEGRLGFEFVSLDQFALVVQAGEHKIRIAKVANFTPFQGTVLGWEVVDVEAIVIWLKDRDVITENTLSLPINNWESGPLPPEIKWRGLKTRTAMFFLFAIIHQWRDR